MSRLFIRYLLLPSALIGATLIVGSFPATGSGQQSDEDSTWKVSAPPGGEDIDIRIDTDEGTWMNLDVSPDGRTIVFDLLGDLYLVSLAEGGEARVLSEGVAWDMQPRFSPDGASIAFTSDRGGGDNIWVMPASGGEARAVTQETFRLLNNPVWSPDGEYIAARKHFSSTRSLGSGEIWLYHAVGGGEGVALNEKPNDQQDLGEPAFSPDGRYVYFSQDVTQGPNFEYNKDSNTELYAIRRIDRHTGEIETVVSGPGGAVRPTPSPDGRSLAFVRRERFQSKLFVHDLESGANRVVYDALDRDMQEIWAIHGLYPNFAWTPDSASLVFWAQGKLQVVDVAGGTPRRVDFRVRQTLTGKKALRFQRDPAPDRYRTRMLRWVSVSPGGERAMFQALGHIYVRELPDGEPRRLTTQTDHFELYPSFSRDGRFVVYVSWDDHELGRLQLAPVSGAESGRILTQKPGHYVEPEFSPNGEHIVYRKASGDRIRSPLWSSEPGLYAVPTEGGEPVKLRRGGRSPHFGEDESRVYFFEAEAWNERFLALDPARSDRRADPRQERGRDRDAGITRRHATGVRRALSGLRHPIRGRLETRDRISDSKESSYS